MRDHDTAPTDARLGPFSIAWLTDEAGDPPAATAEVPAVERIHYALPPDCGQAYVERLDAGSGIQIFRAVHALERAPGGLMPLLEVQSRFDEPLFNAQIWLSGSGCHDEYWHGRRHAPTRIVAGPGRDTFRWLQQLNATVLIEGGVYSEMRSMLISRSTLRQLLGDAEAAALIKRLGLSREIASVVRAMPAGLSRPLCEAVDARFSGPARRLFGQAKALEYLAGLYHFVTASTPAGRPPRHADSTMRLYAQLLAVEGRLPTLDALALEYGLSAQTLNAAFMSMFGQSIFAFITNHRLQQAHAALLETAVPIKVLATRLGYSHVNHFNAAFKRKFGYPPGTLRRGSSSST